MNNKCEISETQIKNENTDKRSIVHLIVGFTCWFICKQTAETVPKINTDEEVFLIFCYPRVCKVESKKWDVFWIFHQMCQATDKTGQEKIRRKNSQFAIWWVNCHSVREMTGAQKTLREEMENHKQKMGLQGFGCWETKINNHFVGLMDLLPHQLPTPVLINALLS